jgi:monooxygenase
MTADPVIAGAPTAGHVDVLIVGAGLSGIGAACHLRRECPDTSFTILEAREAIGGTWDLFRYPGIRSDSDMFTLGYSFRPWTAAQSIADAPSILSYITATAREYGIDRRVRFRHRVVTAQWSTATARWTVTSRRADTGEEVMLTCSFLSVCSGYYRYDEGYRPHFPGEETFTGTIVHPQHWPVDLDYSGKRVVVIGSGATAVTLVPSMAGTAAHVTMLQRSPSYVVALPATDPIADRLHRWLPARTAYQLVRWKNVLLGVGTYQLSRRRPEVLKSILRRNAAKALPAGFDVDTHFSPTYDPWDQRLCVAPDGDLFRAIRSGTAEIVTDRIDEITGSGIELASGRHLDTDIIVAATGLNVLAIGGIALTVDGREIRLSETLAYKGMMLSGVPNFALTVGYTNASWTLKADLVAHYVCRLLHHMAAGGYHIVTPVAPEPALDRDDLAPLIDLKAGYIRRSIDALPRQGPSTPWRLRQNYLLDLRLMRHGPLTDGVRFGHADDGPIGPGARVTAGRRASSS